jgi:hypothetical protein
MRSYIFAVFLMVVVSVMAANPVTGSAELNEDLVRFIDIYNENIGEAPELVKSLLGSERIETRITMLDDSVYVVGIETENARIVQTVEGGFEDWTILVESREEVIREIYIADDPILAIQDALDNDGLTVTGKGWVTKMKIKIFLSNVEALRFFGDLVFQ